jgi:hypothetical protein
MPSLWRVAIRRRRNRGGINAGPVEAFTEARGKRLARPLNALAESQKSECASGESAEADED